VRGVEVWVVVRMQLVRGAQHVTACPACHSQHATFHLLVPKIQRLFQRSKDDRTGTLTHRALIATCSNTEQLVTRRNRSMSQPTQGTAACHSRLKRRDLKRRAVRIRMEPGKFLIAEKKIVAKKSTLLSSMCRHYKTPQCGSCPLCVVQEHKKSRINPG
jgi:hypothetical protein